MKVLPEKLKELSQTIAALVKYIRTVEGCRSCDCFCSPEDENDICLFEEWESREVLDEHLQSEHFKVLLGTTSLLKTPHDVQVYREMKTNSALSAHRAVTIAGG
jgi:quinol monooxygenase YgiN